MAAISRADAVWEGDLTSGKGRVKVASGAFNVVARRTFESVEVDEWLRSVGRTRFGRAT